jgi:hypothetical protein
MPKLALRIAAVVMLLEFACSDCTSNVTQQMPTGVVYKNETDLALKLLRNEELMHEPVQNGNCNGDWTHKMPACYQVCSDWCWATSVTMTGDYYKGQNNCQGFECAVAGHEFGQQCCPWSRSCHNRYNDPGSSCNRGGTDSQMADAASYFTGGRFTHGGPLSQAKLDSALNSKRVVMIHVAWQGGGGHALVIGGCGNGLYYLHDPWGWYGTMGLPQPKTWQALTYQQLLEYCPVGSRGQCGRWVGSIFWSFGDDEGHAAALRRADAKRTLNGQPFDLHDVIV